MTMTLTAADGHELQAFIAGPEDAEKGIVVLQEIFGVNSHIRDVCEFYASKGYRVIAPALFDRIESGVEMGYTAQDVDRGKQLKAKVSYDDALKDIEAAATALAGQKQIGVVGFCWGGTLTWVAACRSSLFSAASCWYGAGIAELRNEKAKCPVQMHFGERDKSIPPEDVEAIRAAQPDVDVCVYDADHGFGCDQRGSYDPFASELARTRTVEFFKANL
ncbi:carboxymethylenebutenolidase [Advenella sp. S44]|uniref:dienelactone hydrolase family protein n=1 Tax=Advenella sp. S44 TaxID=1982755 RepID=UPI000C29CCA4|nr:dienelactone hydrolase family protein [Advenella sp. S44]PJX25932.1 carboxymethylenebutenolidase [Advenella sp. S44]